MSTTNGESAITTYGSRVTSFSAGDQVPSATLNSMQDRVTTMGDELDAVEQSRVVGRTPSEDVNGADTYGFLVTTVYMATNGTTEVLIDDSVDWRDRIIEVSLWVSVKATPSDYLPGGTNDDVAGDDLNGSDGCQAVFFSESGNPGSSDTPGLPAFTPTTSSDDLWLYARSSDGALAMKKSGTASNNFIVMGFVRASPPQNG